MITIIDSTARPAMMNSHRERLADLCPTNTCLTCASRIDFREQPTSIFSFVGQHVHESRYRDVVKGFAQPSARKPYNIQIFDRNKSILINQLARFLVQKVAALIANVVVKTSQKQHSFATSIRSSLSTCYASLESSQFCLSGPIPVRVFDLGSVAKRSERSESDVNSDHVRIERQRIGFTLNTEQSEPATGFTLDSECLNLAIERSVELNPHVPDFREAQTVSNKCISDLAKRETVVTPSRLETWVSRPLTVFDASKEGAEGKMNALQGVFERVSIYRRHVVALSANPFQLHILIEPRDRLGLKSPSVAALLERGIVKLAANSQLVVKNLLLPFRRIDSVAEGTDQGGQF